MPTHTTYDILTFFPQGHLTLPEGPNPEKDHALRHGQLESAESGHLTSGAIKGTFCCYTSYLGPVPSGFCSCLRGTGGGTLHGDAPTLYQSRPGQGPNLLPSSAFYFSRNGTRAPLVPIDEIRSSTSCVHSSLSFKVLDSLFQGPVCVCVCICLHCVFSCR